MAPLRSLLASVATMATKPREVYGDLVWNVTVVCCMSGSRLLALLVEHRAADSTMLGVSGALTECGGTETRNQRLLCTLRSPPFLSRAAVAPSPRPDPATIDQRSDAREHFNVRAMPERSHVTGTSAISRMA